LKYQFSKMSVNRTSEEGDEKKTVLTYKISPEKSISVMLNGQKRLRRKLDELQMEYDMVSENIRYLTEDYHNELDLLRKKILKRRLEREKNVRDELEKQMDEIIKQIENH